MGGNEEKKKKLRLIGSLFHNTKFINNSFLNILILLITVAVIMKRLMVSFAKYNLLVELKFQFHQAEVMKKRHLLVL